MLIPDRGRDPVARFASIVLQAPEVPVTALLPGHKAFLPAPDKIAPACHAEPFDDEAPVLRFPVCMSARWIFFSLPLGTCTGSSVNGFMPV